MIPILLAFAPVSIHGQTTLGHCFGSAYVTDPTWSGETYLMYVRIETPLAPPTGWAYFGTANGVGIANTVSIPNISVGSVPYPSPIPPNFYTMRILAIKSANGPPWTANNASYAYPTYINAFNTRFDPYTDPIEVKFP